MGEYVVKSNSFTAPQRPVQKLYSVQWPSGESFSFTDEILPKQTRKGETFEHTLKRLLHPEQVKLSASVKDATFPWRSGRYG